MKTVPAALTPELLHKIDAYWRAANYLSVGQIYLCENPLLRRPLVLSDVKLMLLGHWGTTPGQNFIYAHLNRVIKAYDLDMIYVSGPGHGGPAVVGNTYLEGTYSEIYPDISQDEAGLQKLFKQFSFPGGIPSHASPECPGSIHEGGELGYSLSHSFGAVFDNPDLIVACVVGDGEAETGPLATSWHSNKFLDPVTDGAVLPILHLNGYKISNPTVLARITREELDQLFRGYGWTPIFVEDEVIPLMHEAMAEALDVAVTEIKRVQHEARTAGCLLRPRWPMIVLNSPKGWTGPKWIDGQQIEGTFRAHQVPLSDPRIKGVALTGGVDAARRVAARAGQNVKKTTMELGGNDAFVVLGDADLDKTVAWAVWAKMNNTGQCCVAGKRFIVAEELADAFLAKFHSALAALKPGDPMDAATTLAPLSTEAALVTLLAQIDRAVAKGAKLLLGGKRIERPGSFMQPTILTNIKPENPAYREEFFGPVALLFRFKTDDEAVALANDSDFGLGGSVFGSDVARAKRVAGRIDTGMVFINHPTWTTADLPFGGIKNSGYGRELSSLGIHEFVNKKLIRTDSIDAPA